MRRIRRPRLLAAASGVLLALAGTGACMTQRHGGGEVVPPVAAATATATVAPRDPGRTRDSYVATGKQAMIATGHPLASEAGGRMLRAGGNAFDAAVAASFVLGVVRPQSTGIGGGGFLVAYDAASRSTEVDDFRETAPAKASRDMYLDAKGNPVGFTYAGATVPDASVNGHLAVGVPGLVKGLLEMHARHGRLPLAQVMQPAIDLAEQGYTVSASLASELVLRGDVMRHFPGTAAVFFPDGRPLKAGDRLVQKDLGWTLRQIAGQGERAFYEGEVARRLIAEMHRGHGLMTAADLKGFKVRHRQPVVGTYRGHKIVSMPPPSSGGAHIIEMLNILSGADYGALGFGTVSSVHLLAETMRRAFADRARYLGDPAFVQVPLSGLLSPAYAMMLRGTIDQSRATRSADVRPGNPAAYEHPETTHLSVVDPWGNAVSSTQTVNYGFGSCVVAQGTGILLNDEMDDFSKKPGVPNAFGLVGAAANEIAPGKIPLSSMSPTLVFGPDGKLELVAGSPGGPRIISATLQTIINRIDFKMPLADAVHATRIHNQWQPDQTVYEAGGLKPPVIEALTRMGHHLVVDGTIGDVQAVGIEGAVLTGVSDTRSEGRPVGF